LKEATAVAGEEPVVAAIGLAKRFGPIVALAGVDLAVPAGAVLAVLGPNGAGKTTLLRILAGLARPSAGTVRYRGGADHRRARRLVGYIGHATFLYPALTARENLRFAARLHGVADADARIARLLAELDLEAFAERPAGAFSRGLAQRLAIARALVHDPGLVLLDEPFTGLDPVSADRLAVRIGALREGGRAGVLVTHDLARAAELADRAVVVVDGRVAFDSGGRPPGAGALETAYRDALRTAA
jgi:heme exporter protein A